MNLQDLFESLSRVAYHYTNIVAAAKILQSGEFQLSSTLGSVEQQYAPKNMPFFLSTTRTKRGGYHSMIGSSAVMFVLNGDWFNNHYVSRPVDYWGNRDPKKVSHRPHEAEDRVFSKDPTIPINGVAAVHILVKPDADDVHSANARKALIGAKQHGIPAYLYEDETAWRNLDTRKSVPITNRPTLRGQERYRRGYDRRAYLQPWVELIQSTNQKQLSKDADKLRYSLSFNYDRQSAAQGLNTDLSNARKPNSGADREAAVKIIRFMQKHNIQTIGELIELLANKWSKTNQEQTNESKTQATSRRPGRTTARSNTQGN